MLNIVLYSYIKQYKQILCGESFYNGNFEGACAGTIESSDAYVGIEPNSELNIQIESIVKKVWGQNRAFRARGLGRSCRDLGYCASDGQRCA